MPKTGSQFAREVMKTQNGLLPATVLQQKHYRRRRLPRLSGA